MTNPTEALEWEARKTEAKKENTTKHLGKITSAEFGNYSDMPFLIGLQLTFSFNGSGVMGDYTVNLGHPDVEDIKQIWHEKGLYLQDLLNNAKVNYVSELVGIPVEIELDGQRFKDFRILTEVL